MEPLPHNHQHQHHHVRVHRDKKRKRKRNGKKMGKINLINGEMHFNAENNTAPNSVHILAISMEFRPKKNHHNTSRFYAKFTQTSSDINRTSFLSANICFSIDQLCVQFFRSFNHLKMGIVFWSNPFAISHKTNVVHLV